MRIFLHASIGVFIESISEAAFSVGFYPEHRSEVSDIFHRAPTHRADIPGNIRQVILSSRDDAKEYRAEVQSSRIGLNEG